MHISILTKMEIEHYKTHCANNETNNTSLRIRVFGTNSVIQTLEDRLKSQTGT